MVQPADMVRPQADQWRITLAVIAGPSQGRCFSFASHDTFIVGRSPRAHFRLPESDPYFSRFHFLVEVQPPLCRLVDLNSHNGTFVNERRVQAPADLSDGDRIRAGTTELRVSIQESQGASLAMAPTRLSADAQVAVGQVPEDVEEVLARQRQDWQQGRCLQVEDYLRDQPELAGQRHLLLDLVQGEYALRQDRGERPTVAEYQRRFPHLAGVLQLVLLPLEGTEMSAPPAPPGRQFAFPDIPGYRIEEELGQGGMGIVYRAVCLADGSQVALKTIVPGRSCQREVVQRFLREAQILGQLRHPHIVAFRDFGQAGDFLYFAMEYVAGTDAGKLVHSEGPLALGRATFLINQILEALAQAHQQGFVHRDLKPGNLLITGSPGQEKALLADFGLARTYQDSPLSGLTLAGSAAGTPQFMPPEQLTDFRSVQPAADQYAAAATLYYLLTARPLYQARSVSELLQRILQEDPPPVHQRGVDLPAELAAVLGRALARKAEDRFPGVTALRLALLPFAHKSLGGTGAGGVNGSS